MPPKKKGKAKPAAKRKRGRDVDPIPDETESTPKRAKTEETPKPAAVLPKAKQSKVSLDDAASTQPAPPISAKNPSAAKDKESLGRVTAPDPLLTQSPVPRPPAPGTTDTDPDDVFQRLLITQRKCPLSKEYCCGKGFELVPAIETIMQLTACLFLTPQICSASSYLMYKWHSLMRDKVDVAHPLYQRDMHKRVAGLVLAVAKVSMTYPPKAKLFGKSFKTFTIDDVLRAESFMLQELRFEVLVPTPIEIIQQLFDITSGNDKHRVNAIGITLLAYRNPLCMQYTPYILARAALLTAKGLDMLSTGHSPKMIRKLVSGDLSPVCDEVRSAVQTTSMFDLKMKQRFVRLTGANHTGILSGVNSLSRIYKGLPAIDPALVIRQKRRCYICGCIDAAEDYDEDEEDEEDDDGCRCCCNDDDSDDSDY